MNSVYKKISLINFKISFSLNLEYFIIFPVDPPSSTISDVVPMFHTSMPFSMLFENSIKYGAIIIDILSKKEIYHITHVIYVL